MTHWKWVSSGDTDPGYQPILTITNHYFTPQPPGPSRIQFLSQVPSPFLVEAGYHVNIQVSA